MLTELLTVFQSFPMASNDANKQNLSDDIGEGKTLDPTGFQRLNDVRKDVWRGGIAGLIGGALSGEVLFQISRSIPSLRKHHSRNVRFATIMCTASFGSFLTSLIYGQKSVVYVGDVFLEGSKRQTSQDYESRRVAHIVESNESRKK